MNHYVFLGDFLGSVVCYFNIYFLFISADDPMTTLEKLQREKRCKVCMDNDINIVFIPCGHLATCQKCSESLLKCPICCASIVQKIKAYIG